MEVSALVKRDGGSSMRRLARLLSVAAVVVTLSSCGLDKLSTKPWTESLENARNDVKAGDMVKAEDDFQKAAKAAEAKFGHNSNQVATCTFELADMYMNMQEWRKARIVLEDLNDIYDKLGVNTPGEDREKAKLDLIKVKKKIRKYHLEPSDKDKADKEKADKDQADKDKEKEAGKDKAGETDKDTAKEKDQKSEKETGKDKSGQNTDSTKPSATQQKDAPAKEKGK